MEAPRSPFSPAAMLCYLVLNPLNLSNLSKATLSPFEKWMPLILCQNTNFANNMCSNLTLTLTLAGQNASRIIKKQLMHFSKLSIS